MTLNSVVLSPTSSTSTSATGSGSSAVVNASRLRENQRRSRARKKEYLVSLEARLQACQRTGVEANVEIQVAAKKVVRENKLLRAMLVRRGVTDSEINKTLKDGGEEEGSDEVGRSESAVEGVLRVLGKRPCGGEPTTGGAAMQCKPFRSCEGQKRTANERCNSTGTVATRGAERGGGRGAVNGGAPTLAVATSKLPSPPLQPPHQQHTSSNYPTPTHTPTTASASRYPIPTSAPQLTDFYNYNISSAQSQPTYMTSPTISSPSPPSYNSFEMTPTTPTLTNNSSSRCSQPQSSFYLTSQPQCAPLRMISSSMPSCCPTQRPLYATATSSCASAYQTAAIASTTTPCHLAQSFINQLHPGLPGENASSLIEEICPSGMMQGGQCHVDNAVLFGVLDRI